MAAAVWCSGVLFMESYSILGHVVGKGDIKCSWDNAENHSINVFRIKDGDCFSKTLLSSNKSPRVLKARLGSSSCEIEIVWRLVGKEVSKRRVTVGSMRSG